jgi:hypothetical protein
VNEGGRGLCSGGSKRVWSGNFFKINFFVSTLKSPYKRSHFDFTLKMPCCWFRHFGKVTFWSNRLFTINSNFIFLISTLHIWCWFRQGFLKVGSQTPDNAMSPLLPFLKHGVGTFSDRCTTRPV